MMLTRTNERPGALQVAQSELGEGPGTTKEARSLTTQSRDISLSPLNDPVTGSDTGSIVFNPTAMKANYPYRFRFLDHWMFVVADWQGYVNIYYLPNNVLA